MVEIPKLLCYNIRERCDAMEIGKIIEKRRKELVFSLEEVGNAVGVGKSTVKNESEQTFPQWKASLP